MMKSLLFCVVFVANMMGTSGYEVWMGDQGGAVGTTLRIYGETSLRKLVNDPIVLNTSDLFPLASSLTGAPLRLLHGLVQSPDRAMVTLNYVGSGHLVIMHARTRAPMCLFRTTGSTTGRQNHMTVWTTDGHYLLVSNQNGRLMERVRVDYHADGSAANFTFEAPATLDLVGGDRIRAQPVAVPQMDGVGCRVEGVVPNNQPTETPLGFRKQEDGRRPANNVVCALPVPRTNHVMVTLSGGGLFVVDYTVSPMAIVAEYDISVIKAAGCGGIASGNYFYVNSGTPRASVSGFSLYRMSRDYPNAPSKADAPNTPAVVASYEDPLNGQSVPASQQRDAHGMVLTRQAGGLIHQLDRVQDTVDVFSTFQTSLTPVSRYNLRASQVCGTTLGAPLVNGLPLRNKPTPDLGDASPTGDFIYVALRGPVPITVAHAAVGSCPGLGVIQLEASGTTGTLIGVLPTTDLSTDGTRNLSDNHAAIVVRDPVSCKPRRSRSPSN